MRVKNWREFQHYKHRDPPWIRLYRKLLNDREWFNLSGDAAKVLIGCWLIAGENDGILPPLKDLSFRLRISEKQLASALSELSHWLEQDASNALAERAQGATPETDNTETDNTETECAASAPSAKDELARVLDSEHVAAVIEHRKKLRKPLTARAASLLAARFAKWPKPNEAADAMIANGWQGFEVAWMQNRRTNGPDPPIVAGGPPPGFREARSTGEYVAYMREKLNDPKIEQGDWRLSKWQHVPVDFTPIRKVSP